MPVLNDQNIERLFGADDAENEQPERFVEYFYYNNAYLSLISGLPIRVLVGHKGVGKSALLKRAYLEDQKAKTHSLFLRPNDLVAITEEASRKQNFISKIEAWKEGILREIIDVLARKLYKSATKDTVPELSTARTRDLLEILERILTDNSALPADMGSRTVHVYIDDIDRGWTAAPADINNISALLNAIRDLSGSTNEIKFRIGLRSDVYFLVRTSDESTDKIERNIVWLKWDNNEILQMAAKRIQTYFGIEVDEASLASMRQIDIANNILVKVIDKTFAGQGHWKNRPIHNVLLSLTRARPRDLIKLFHASARLARNDGSQIITSKNLGESFAGYSQERLQDIINEFRSEMPEIEKLLLNMKPTKKERLAKESFLFTTDQLSRKIQEILSHVNLSFTNKRRVDVKSLIQFMYKIDFITARREVENRTERHYFNESRFLANEVADFGYSWEVHPAYRWALQPQDTNDIFESLARGDNPRLFSERA